MKKFLLYLTGIFIPVSMLVLLEGCSSEEDIPYKNSTERTIAEEYLEASEKAAVLNKDAFNEIGVSISSRATTKDDIVGYLLTLSPEEIEDLYISLDGENQEIKTDELVSLKLDSLMQVAPAEDVAKLYSLMDDYVSAGGHSVTRLETACTSIESPIVRGMAVNSAAIYDNITTPETAASLATVSRTTRACVLQLAFDCGGIAIGACSTAMDFADGNYGFAIIGCVHDVVSIVSAIRSYHRCGRLAAWR